MAEAALGEYDAALSYGTDVEAIWNERQLLLLALALTRNSERVLELAASLPESARITRRYAKSWYREQTVPEFRDEELDQAARQDLRSLGLLAYLCGNLETTIEAWSRLRLETADPLLEATLGNIYLALDEPQLAYPRLQSAHRAFPEAAVLMVYLADAAVRCGDVRQARLLLEQARGLEIRDEDDFSPHRRVEMMCLLAEGNIEGAFTVYEDEAANLFGSNPVAGMQLANFLEQAGDELGALRVLAGRLADSPDQTTPQKYARLMEAWWSRLPRHEREQLVQPAEAREPSVEAEFASLLANYKTALERLATYPDWHPLAQRANWTRLATPTDAEALATAREELLTITTP